MMTFEVIAVCGDRERAHRIVCQEEKDAERAIDILNESLTRRGIVHSILVFVTDGKQTLVSGADR